MSASLLQSKSGNGGGYVQSVDIAFESNNAVGSTIILAVAGAGDAPTPTISDSQGNTYALINTGVNDYVTGWFYYAENIDAGANTITIDFGADYEDVSYCVYEYAGLETSSVLDKKAENLDSEYGTSHSTGTTATTSQADELIVAMACGDSNSTWSLAGWDNELEANGNDIYQSLAMYSKVVSSVGTQSASISSSAAMKGYAAIATFKIASVASPKRETNFFHFF